MAENYNVIAPQPGPQTKFAACTADIAVYGGSVGGGKSFGVLLEAAKWVNLPGYEAVIFRRNAVDLTGSGSIWTEAKRLYRQLGGNVREKPYLDVTWPNDSMIQFAHLHLEDDVFSWQGRQLAFAAFDEGTHFTATQIWYIWTRLRTMCGIKPYMRITVNPDPDSFIAELISWWIGEDGYPIPERDGVIRWFCRIGDAFKWFDSETECQQFLTSIGDEDATPISFTFIRSTLEDNPALLAKNPGYRGQVAATDEVTRARLLGGNWKIRARSGGMFDRTWFDIIDELPDQSQWSHIVRGWDKAGTKPNPQNEDPDWTRGVKGLWLKSGLLVIWDMVSLRAEPGHVDDLIVSTAKIDGPRVTQAFWRDGGQSGKVDEMHTTELLRKKCPNVRVVWEGETKSKEQYAKPFASFCDPVANDGQRRVLLLRAPWNAEFLAELERFPKPKGVSGKGVHDDVVDASSRMWLEIAKGKTGDVARMLAMASARA